MKESELKVEKAKLAKEEELIIKREIENLKWADREETVQRIKKINEYNKEKVMEKI